MAQTIRLSSDSSSLALRWVFFFLLWVMFLSLLLCAGEFYLEFLGCLLWHFTNKICLLLFSLSILSYRLFISCLLFRKFSLSTTTKKHKTPLTTRQQQQQVDLKDISKCFSRKYNKTLHDFIKGDCGGDYKRLLLAILGNN